MTLIALTFLATFCVDWLWALYTRRVAAGAVLAAGSYSAILYALAGFVTTMYVADPRLLVIAGLGAFCGTATAVWLDKRKPHATQETCCCDAPADSPHHDAAREQ